MSRIKNKASLYIILRHDFSGKDIVVASCLTSEKADDLVGEYTQLFIDTGFSEEEVYFYSCITIFYDQ